MMKKVALLCALVMLVSIVPAFAASGDTPIKKQTKLQQKLKTQDGTCTTTNTQDQTKTQTKIKKQLKTQDKTGTKTQTKDQTKIKKQLKDGSCTNTVNS